MPRPVKGAITKMKDMGYNAVMQTRPESRREAWGGLTAKKAREWIWSMSDADERDYPSDDASVKEFCQGVRLALGTRKNPHLTILGHSITQNGNTYTVDAYNESFRGLPAVTAWLQKHVAAERVRQNPQAAMPLRQKQAYPQKGRYLHAFIADREANVRSVGRQIPKGTGFVCTPMSNGKYAIDILTWGDDAEQTRGDYPGEFVVTQGELEKLHARPEQVITQHSHNNVRGRYAVSTRGGGVSAFMKKNGGEDDFLLFPPVSTGRSSARSRDKNAPALLTIAQQRLLDQIASLELTQAAHADITMPNFLVLLSAGLIRTGAATRGQLMPVSVTAAGWRRAERRRGTAPRI